jgi:hypothetical protein
MQTILTNSYKIDFNTKSSKINKKVNSSKYNIYYVFNYDKNFICIDDNEVRNYRSVIFSYLDRKLLCFSPPKSITENIFFENNSLLQDESIIVNELIEGIMINLFYDKSVNRWEIATKNSVGCNYWFYGKSNGSNNENNENKTFYYMFLDALRANEGQELNDLPLLEYFCKSMSYTFILQHPNNKIILPIDYPTLFLVAVYYIYPYEAVYVSPHNYKNWTFIKDIEGIINHPKQYDIRNYNIDSYKKLKNLFLIEKELIKGVVVTNTTTGEHTTIKNREYEYLKLSKLFAPNLQYHYFCLRRIGQTENYLKFYPSMKKTFNYIQNEYFNYVLNVHSAYMLFYIDKKYDIHHKYMTHIYNIHQKIYLASLRKSHDKSRESKQIVTYQKVLEYFDKMEPRELLFIINENRRLFS